MRPVRRKLGCVAKQRVTYMLSRVSPRSIDDATSARFDVFESPRKSLEESWQLPHSHQSNSSGLDLDRDALGQTSRPNVKRRSIAAFPTTSEGIEVESSFAAILCKAGCTMRRTLSARSDLHPTDSTMLTASQPAAATRLHRRIDKHQTRFHPDSSYATIFLAILEPSSPDIAPWSCFRSEPLPQNRLRNSPGYS